MSQYAQKILFFYCHDCKAVRTENESALQDAEAAIRSASSPREAAGSEEATQIPPNPDAKTDLPIAFFR